MSAKPVDPDKVGEMIAADCAPRSVRPVAALFSRAMRTSFAQRRLAPHVGRLQLWLYRRTGGRFQLSALLVPSLLLISTGAPDRPAPRHTVDVLART